MILFRGILESTQHKKDLFEECGLLMTRFVRTRTAHQNHPSYSTSALRQNLIRDRESISSVVATFQGQLVKKVELFYLGDCRKRYTKYRRRICGSVRITGHSGTKPK